MTENVTIILYTRIEATIDLVDNPARLKRQVLTAMTRLAQEYEKFYPYGMGYVTMYAKKKERAVFVKTKYPENELDARYINASNKERIYAEADRLVREALDG